MKRHTVYGRDILRDFTAIEGIGMGASVIMNDMMETVIQMGLLVKIFRS